MNQHKPSWLVVGMLAVLFTACGVDRPSQSSSSSYSSTSALPAEPFIGAIPQQNGYTKLTNGQGGFNYESIDLNAFAHVDLDDSFSVFSKTLYPLLIESGCGDCHNSEGDGQAPLVADKVKSHAHNYALTMVNFHSPEQSRLVEKVSLYRHQCWQWGCEALADELAKAVTQWQSQANIELVPVPKGTEPELKISTSSVEAWIDSDRKAQAEEDLPYLVYTSLHELQNQGLTANELNIVRVALSKTLNSVARWAPKIVNPQDVNGKGILYRFDIRDYWGYNQGVQKLLFSGSDDDLAFGNGKLDYLGREVNVDLMDESYGFTGETLVDPEHAKLIWQRVLHGNVEGSGNSGNLPTFMDGFHGDRKQNAAGDYIDAADLEWVEASQLIFILTRPDVYTAVMTHPFFADELERNLALDVSKGLNSYDYMVTRDSSAIDAHFTMRGKTKDGWLYKNFAIMTLAEPQTSVNTIQEIYDDQTGEHVRFPFWANPIPKFIEWKSVASDDSHFSFVATLAQAVNQEEAIEGFIPASTEGCNSVSGLSIELFRLCLNYTGTGGMQQSESQIAYSLANGLNGYYLAGGQNQRRLNMFVNTQRDPRRLGDVGDDVVYNLGYDFTLSKEEASSTLNAPRLNAVESCMGCHVDGLVRANNNLRDWLDHSPERLPTGEYGVDNWIDDPDVVAKVRSLYPSRSSFNQQIENDKLAYLRAMGIIKSAMILGEDKNMYVEPVVWSIELARSMYHYPKFTDN